MPAYIYNIQGDYARLIFDALKRLAPAVLDELHNGSVDEIASWATRHRLEFDCLLREARGRHANGRNPRIVFSGECFQINQPTAEREYSTWWAKESETLIPTDTETKIQWRKRADAVYAKALTERRRLFPRDLSKEPVYFAGGSYTPANKEQLTRDAEWLVRHRVLGHSYKMIALGPPVAESSAIAKAVQRAIDRLNIKS